MDVDLTTLKKTNDKKPKEDPNQKWTPAQEQLLAEWSEKAACFRWLHSRSEKAYRFRNYSFTIPVIILSTLTGTANFAMDSFVPEEYKQIAMACVGGVNIFAGILSTLQNFLRYAELMESHRLCEVQWSKFGRNISVELAIDPKRRKPADDFLKVCRAEYDRLIEQSPPIDDPIIKQFKRNFKDSDVRKPDICNGLDKCKIFQPSEEEKHAAIIATTGSKLLERRKSKQWNPVEVKRDLPKKINPTFKSHSNESKKELDGLLNMGRVSSFKNPPNIDISQDAQPLEIIHEIVRNNKPCTNCNSDPEPLSEPDHEPLSEPDNEPVPEPLSEPAPEPDLENGLNSDEVIIEETKSETDMQHDFLEEMDRFNDK